MPASTVSAVLFFKFCIPKFLEYELQTFLRQITSVLIQIRQIAFFRSCVFITT